MIRRHLPFVFLILTLILSSIQVSAQQGDPTRGRRVVTDQPQNGDSDENRGNSETREEANRRDRRTGARGREAAERSASNRSRRGNSGSRGEGGMDFVGSESLQAMADPDMAVLYLDPPSLYISEGDEFTTTLTLSNPANRSFKRLQVTLAYNDAVMRPIAQQPGPALSSEITSEVWSPSEGLATLFMEFPSERSDARLDILDIRWEARREIRSSPIRFSNSEAHRSRVENEVGSSILGSWGHDSKGVIATSVTVLPDLGIDAALNAEEGEALNMPWMVETISEIDDRDAQVALVLQPRLVEPGVLDVDIVMQNPLGSFGDDVAIRINYDPERLQVVDQDDENWIESGVNILDGPYHERHPFDVHVMNEADNELGVITYRMGYSEETPLASGPLATIRFEVLPGAGRPSLSFDPEYTAVLNLGYDMLGDPVVMGDGMVSDMFPPVERN